MRRLSQEIAHVAQVIIGEGMVAQSMITLQQKFQETQQLLTYYAQFVCDCFGENESSEKVAHVSDYRKFSLNSP